MSLGRCLLCEGTCPRCGGPVSEAAGSLGWILCSPCHETFRHLDCLRLQLREKVTAIDGVMSGGSVFGGLEGFWIDQKLVAELIDENSFQVRMTKPVIREHKERFAADERIEPRKNSDWVTVHLGGPDDFELIAELVELAAPVYRPRAGATTIRPPPAGSDLEKRRRWH